MSEFSPEFMSELAPVFAAIDCGTNAIRLLIARVEGESVTDIVREMRTVRLGEGVDTEGEFSLRPSSEHLQPAENTRKF